MMASRLIDRIGEFNPQLFREIKGRLTPRNLLVTAATSFVGQLLIFLYFTALLPTKETFNRYCTGARPADVYPNYYSTGNDYCIRDLTGQIMLLKPLWWLDLFFALSIMGIFAILIIGSYVLIADLSKEESRGTLNFIRLSPEMAKNIFTGKIFGVPILLYTAIGLAAPLHIVAGLKAHIPSHLILGFYGVVVAACAFFYCASLVFTLATGWLGGFQSWLGSGLVFLFTFSAMTFTSGSFGGYSTTFDWLNLLYPGFVLPYLVKATFIAPAKISYFNNGGLSDLTWYGHALWANAFTGMGFIILHFSLWTYALTKALKRRFYNPLATLLSKSQSYWLTACFTFVGMGFTLQNVTEKTLLTNLSIFNAFLVVFFLILIVCLSPHRQVLQDWARYRHQEKNRQSLLKELAFGDKSPSTVCLGLNLLIVLAFVTPIILLSPLKEYKLSGLAGFFLGLNMMLIYGVVSQWLLLQKNSRRAIVATSGVALIMVAPLLCFGALGIAPGDNAFVWTFSVLPIVAIEYASKTTIALAIFAQWTVLAAMGLHMTKQLRQAGASASKVLMATN
ncbi:MAG: hypothetical protein N5P05_002429 [Chroococcopsis gigantea SAG 12.99]|jgi:hypothetical protein|nr:hypothetical protein [Chroococcopsis gigantea SAG 12.99]